MNHRLTVRPSCAADLPRMMRMFAHSRCVMRRQGNSVQWVGYPTRRQATEDMSRGVSFVVEDEGRTVGTFALVPGDEPTYAYIEHGRWIDNLHPYATIHRVAAMPATHGIAAAALAFAKQHYAYLRIDTHERNTAMRHIVAREDFVQSGIVYMTDGSERLAYEWWRWDEVDSRLKRYVEQQVLPVYDTFDPAHRRDHALRVIARSMLLADGKGLNPNMVYAIAALHDLGLGADGCPGESAEDIRERHHLVGGDLARSNTALRQWFSADEREQIAQAIEDHRASSRQVPRSLYGCVVAEADRDVEPERIVLRTVQYGLGHYPALDREGHWQRTLQHLDEKYAAGGYLHLLLADSPNAEPLAELQRLIADRRRLRSLFDQIVDRLSTQDPKFKHLVKQ